MSKHWIEHDNSSAYGSTEKRQRTEASNATVAASVDATSWNDEISSYYAVRIQHVEAVTSLVFHSACERLMPLLDKEARDNIASYCGNMIKAGLEEQIQSMIEKYKRLHFCGLPKEIRERIYSFVLCDEKKEVCLQPATIWQVHDDPGHSLHGKLTSCRCYGLTAYQRLPSILMASRAIRREAMPIYCRGKLFTIYACHWKFPCLTVEDRKDWSLEQYPDLYAEYSHKGEFNEVSLKWFQKWSDPFKRAKARLRLLGAQARLIERLSIRFPEARYDKELWDMYPNLHSEQREAGVKALSIRAKRLLNHLALEDFGVAATAIEVLVAKDPKEYVSGDWDMPRKQLTADLRWVYTREKSVWEDVLMKDIIKGSA